MLTVAPSSIASLEAAAELPALLAEYAAESAIEGMPPPSARMETYRQLEAGGLLHTIAATVDARLVGFITVLAATLPHYGVTTAVAESFFVAKAERRTGAGLRLLRAAEARARELGAPGLLVSAPFEGDLFRVLPRVGYRETNRVYFKALGAVPQHAARQQPAKMGQPQGLGCPSTVPAGRIPAMGDAAIGAVRRLESLSLAHLPQVPIATDHVLHAGLYARTVRIPAGVVITGVLVKIPTLVIVQGEALMYGDGGPVQLSGYSVLQADGGRKQAFVAETDITITMIFPTAAQTVDEAEREFTDEVELLASRRSTTCSTGEPSCQA